MSRLQELDAISRERALTEAEVDALYKALAREKRRPTSKSYAPLSKRERYQRCKDVVNARRRWRWENDPEWRERKRVNDKAWRERRKEQCSPA